MKVRQGFVSNSSTSSFLIYGVQTSNFSVEKLLENLGIDKAKAGWVAWYAGQQEKHRETHPDWYPDTTWEEWLEGSLEDPSYLIGHQLPKFMEGSDFSGFTLENPWDDDYYIGLDPRSMDDSETMGEFKARAGRIIRPMVDEDTEFGWQEEAWRDG